MKLYLYICNPERFLQADYTLSLEISSYDPEYAERVFGNWIHAGEVEVEIDVDEQKIRQIALDALTKRQEQTRAESQVKINIIETRKQNLLALTAPGAE